MKQKLLIKTIVLLICILTGCNNDFNLTGEDDMYLMFGKNLEIIISENDIVDSEHLQKVLDGKIQKDIPYFDMWNDKELSKLIEYMSDNNYIIVPGRYVINQAWRFSDGKFVLNNGDKRVVLKFKKRSEPR